MKRFCVFNRGKNDESNSTGNLPVAHDDLGAFFLSKFRDLRANSNQKVNDMISSASRVKVVFWAFFSVGALFSNAAYAECKFTNGNPVNGPLPSTQHCSRGYLVPNDQDFCERGALSNYRPKVAGGIAEMKLGVDKFGKPYAVGKAKCIPGGLVVLDGWNWCQFDPVGKVNGEVIKVGQRCNGTIIDPLPPSN